ncbi:hypothetical protein BH23GEM9_BH23GEM9_02100 [soil metagenome]
MADVETMFPSPDRHEAEIHASGELERLPGVLAAATWIDTRGHVRDARLWILPGVAPTIVANAAARVLHALGLTFDQRAVRITHVSLPEELQGYAAVPGTGSNRFLVLQDINLHRSGAHVTCRVQLVRDDTSAGGEARELDTGAGRARAAAKATLRAAENATENIALGLEAALITQLFGRSYAAVAVEASVGRRVASLSAIVPIEPGRAMEESVCMATLRAIDRWIGG